MIARASWFFQLITLLIFMRPIYAGADEFLAFPLNKTEIKILPQRFEYELIDKDHFRVGNTLFNANDLDFQITPNGNGSYSIKFKWSGGLLTKGEVLLKDNAGKAVWQEALKPQEVKVEKIKSGQPGEADPNKVLRSDIATYSSKNLDANSMKRIRLAPFFKFCLHREESLTRIYLCSKEFYFKRTGKRLTIKNRDSYRPDAFVQINGRPVGNQGIIFLQSLDDTISMSAQLASGASIILDTRLKVVDFVDVAQQGESVFLTARGSEPVNDEQVLRRNGDTWTVELKGARPTLFLRGEGDIPMRQEFVINGKIRPVDLKIPITTWNSLGTYTSTNSVKLQTTPEMSLKEVDKSSKVTKDASDLWVWNVNDLEPGQSNRRFVNVTSSSGTYVGSADFPRGLRNEINFTLLAPLAVASFKFQQAINPRWSWDLSYMSFAERQNQEPNLSTVTGEIQYRFTPGINLKDPSHGLTASVDQFYSDAFNLLGFSVGGFLSYAAPEKYKALYDSTLFRVKAPVAGSGGNFALAPSFIGDFVFKKQWGDWTWEAGTRYQTYRFTASKTEVDLNRWNLLFGVSQFF